MKIAVLDINKVADSTALQSITEASLSDLDKKYNIADGKVYRYLSMAKSGDYQPTDASGSSGWWIGCEQALSIVYPVLDTYDFGGLSATEITGAEKTKWTAYFEVKGMLPSPIATETKSKDWGNVTTAERDLIEPINIGDTCFNITTNKPEIVNNSLEWVDYLSGWQPPPPHIGLVATSGVSIFRAIGGGLQYSFDGASDDELSANIMLKNNGISYDGSTVSLTVYYQLSTNAAATEDANILLDKQFVTIGDDTDASPTTIDERITLDNKLAGQVYSYTFTATFAGTAGDDVFMFSSMINASGAGQGSYTGSIWQIGYELNKV